MSQTKVFQTVFTETLLVHEELSFIIHWSWNSIDFSASFGK